jgi:hypothetical protein
VLTTLFSPTLLLQMCKIADMWDAPACLDLCAAALAQQQQQQNLMQPQEFAAMLQLLPEAVRSTPQITAWQAGTVAAFVKQYNDVHSLVTSAEMLLTFRELPYPAIKAWMASDDLIVDSEDSVAVAIGWWVGGDEDSKCSEEQLKELSRLLRVKHLTAGEASVACPHCKTDICSAPVVTLASAPNALLLPWVACSIPHLSAATGRLVQGHR